MKLVMTMAGLGSRFKKAGYTEEKYAIPFRGHTLLEWSFVSLRSFAEHELIVVTRDFPNIHADIAASAAQCGFREPQIVVLDAVTGGQAETVMRAERLLAEDDAILVWNCDTYVQPEALRPEDVRGDGWIPTFEAPGDRWSFVVADADGRASQVTEKVRVSDDCSIGMYYFRRFGEFRKAYAERSNDGESYVAPLYERFITDGLAVYGHRLPSDVVTVLGTPEDLDEAAAIDRPVWPEAR